MIVIVFIGIMVDIAFSRVDRSVRSRYGLLDAYRLARPPDDRSGRHGSATRAPT